ncbi:MAG: class IIb bacteriocin, lactobin A/cerein 7B family [Cyclobacteriaceae bacterium]|jgi:lactobin A/cerein 7B family class IIb bacteriocin
MKTFELEDMGVKELQKNDMSQINGGKADAKSILGLGLAVIGVVALFVAPPTAFFIVPAATAAGIGLGSAIDDVIGD